MAKFNKTGAYKPVEKIDIYIWGRYVGACALDPILGYYVFAYDRDFGKSGIELSPLHMPLRDTEEPFVFTDLPEATYKRLPALLADSLPDDFGNALINRYLAGKGVAATQISPLDRLAYMGDRSMGALEFRPRRGPKNETSTALEMNALVGEARKLVRGTLESSDNTSAALRSVIDVGTSAGGARAKAEIGRAHV